MLLPHRREADAAIAEQDRGDAMPARRRQQRVPHRLAVVMRVHVDPAGGDQEAVGVDLALPGPALLPTAVSLPPSIAISPVKASAPVPSRIVPPRMTMSCMVFVPKSAFCAADSMRPRPHFGNRGRHAVHGRRHDPRAGRGTEAVPGKPWRPCYLRLPLDQRRAPSRVRRLERRRNVLGRDLSAAGRVCRVRARRSHGGIPLGHCGGSRDARDVLAWHHLVFPSDAGCRSRRAGSWPRSCCCAIARRM